MGTTDGYSGQSFAYSLFKCEVRIRHGCRVGRDLLPLLNGSDTLPMFDTFDVGSVMRSLGESEREASTVAGIGGMDRPVRRARIASRPGQLDSPAQDELIVTTTGTLLFGEPANDLISRLHRLGVAAAMVRLDADEPLPPQMLALADSLEFPIITFPATTALADVTAAVLNAILEAQNHRVERIIEIREQFTATILGGGGIPEVAKQLQELLGRPVAVIDDNQQLILLVPADAAWSDAALNRGAISVLRHPLLAGGQHYGEIVLDDAATPLNDEESLALERASIAISVRLAHARATAMAQERFAVTSLEELISNHAGDRAEIAERASSFGWDLSRRRAVLLASIDPPTDPSTLPGALRAIEAAARATLGPDAIVWQRTAAIAALVAPDSDQLEERKQLADKLRTELDRTVSTVTVSVGVGRCADGPLQLARSYLEASRSVDVGRWVRGRHATEVYDGLGLERLLATASPSDLAEFVEQAIGPLLEHDRSQHTNLVQTLGAFLQTRNMAETARRLFVHYNTLKNRLERIESIMGPVLEDAARSLEAQVAVHVFEHYDGPWAAPGKDERLR